MVLETLLRETTTRRDLLLRTTAFAFRDIDPLHVKVVVAVEPLESTVTLAAAAFALIDVRGDSAAQWSEEGAAIVARPVLTAAAVPPGDYRLRVAATDTTGRRGTVDYEFTAALTDAPPITMGTLMAGWLDQGTFRPRLIVDGSVPDVTGYLEFYGSLPSGAVLSARFEVAAGPDGPALATAPGSVLGSPQATRFVATGTVPLTKIGRGDYVLRAVISINDRPAGTAHRTIRRMP